MGAQENAHRPTSDFIGPISISNFTPSVLFIWRMHDRIGMVKNTWKAISHLSGYTFNQITIFIEVTCFKRKIHAQIFMDQRETSKGKIKKNLKVPLQPMDRKEENRYCTYKYTTYSYLEHWQVINHARINNEHVESFI